MKAPGAPTARLEGGLSAPLGSSPLGFHQSQIFLGRRMRPMLSEEHGRGLGIVEVLARDWGTRMADSG